jgi:sugar (pentulose or hexulose) kinase
MNIAKKEEDRPRLHLLFRSPAEGEMSLACLLRMRGRENGVVSRVGGSYKEIDPPDLSFVQGEEFSMRYLGIDLGTSFIKGAVLDLDTLSVGSARRMACPPPLPALPPLHSEFDPESFVAATLRLVGELLAEAPDCHGLLMCGQMGGLVLVSPEGEALSPYISWQDRRLLEPHPSGRGSYFDALLGALTEDDWRDLGREIRPGTPLSYLFWLVQKGQEIPGGAAAATLPDFVLARLCGTAPATHPSNAVGAINILTRDWHFPLFRRLGFGRVRWPALREIDEPAGEVRLAGRRLPGYAPVGDHPCALAGVLLDLEELSLNISTGSQVSLRSTRPDPGDYQTIPFFDGEFLHRISNLPAGRALDALVRLLRELAEAQGIDVGDPWPYIVRAAAGRSRTDLDANLAFFPTPLGESGSLTNLREENLTVGDLFRAAFGHMAENYYASALRLSRERTWRRLVFSGGLAQKLDLLRGLILERFRTEHRVGTVTEDTLNGLLILALVASGRTHSVQGAMDLLRQTRPKG